MKLMNLLKRKQENAVYLIVNFCFVTLVFGDIKKSFSIIVHCTAKICHIMQKNVHLPMLFTMCEKERAYESVCISKWWCDVYSG